MYKELQPLLNVIEKNEKNYDLEKIKSAFVYAAELHAGQFRLSGEPYICHPVSVAVIVAELGLDTDSICAALLHDTVEDTPLTIHDIEAAFGPETAAAVDAISRREDEAWSDYLDRVAVNPIARQARSAT